MSRVVAGAIAALLMVAAALLDASADAAAAPARPEVDVIQIDGLLDAVESDFWLHALRDAERVHAVVLVVQIDSTRSVLSAARHAKLTSAIAASPTPVAIWVGPVRTGRVGGNNRTLLDAADVVGVAPGAHVLDHRGPVKGALRSPTLGDFIVDIGGHGGITIPTTIIRRAGHPPQRQPQVDVRFAKPSLAARTVHGVTSPGPAFAMLVVGLLLAVLEFATAGVGLAAVTAAILVTLGALGLGGLPVNGYGVGLIVFAVFGMSIDLQAGAPRVWTVIGAASLVGGTLALFRDGMSVPIVWALAVFGLTAAFMLAGLPSLVRARFSSPTIGRDSLIGELGAASGPLGPEGVVSVRGATWRARTNRATPIGDGEAIRVTGIDGLVLEVEPEEGGAKDYRERSKATR